jgi:glycerol-3-phosphate acyltransferase PlsY
MFDNPVNQRCYRSMDALVVIGAYVLGAVPFSQIVSMRVAGTDLRAVGTGTVSGTGLYRIGGLWPLIVGGGLDVLKGVAAALLAGDDHALAVVASAAVVIGHCWSVFLRGAGGRGISPALGTLAVLYWPGALMLLAGLALGRLVKETGLATLIADVLLVGLLTVTNGGWGLALGLAVVLPMLVKRVLGNTRASADPRVYLNRLWFDADRHGTDTAMDSAALEKTIRLLATAVQRHREELNRLNVYPVPDGDTGDNLAALMDSVTERLSNAGDVVDAIATGALRGGRGSSGVIFGQALRGFVTGLQPGPRGLADALTSAATAARDAVADPVEGTILTVSADAARRAVDVASTDGSVRDVAEAAAEEGRRSLARTPDLLPELGGLIDAGGLGYVLFLDSLAEVLTGTARPPLQISAAGHRGCGAGIAGGGRYEVVCLLAAGEDQVAGLREQWLSLGDTVAIAGGDRTWRCHVHTDDVDGALAAARATGTVSDVEISDLAGQLGGRQ